MSAAHTGLRLQLGCIRVLVTRDLIRFFRQRSRVVGALVQPLIFWLVIGSGMTASFHAPSAAGVSYLQYFFPGVVMLVVLFTSIFTTMSVIEDRHHGFLQAVLTSPATRPTLVLGKTLGGVAIALGQALAFALLAPLAGYPLSSIDWPLLVGALFASALGLAAIGFAVAWWLDSTQGYHVVMSVVLIPAWIVSSAMFPMTGASPWLAALIRYNPLAYCVGATRRALGGAAHARALGGTSGGATLELGVAVAFAACAVLAAAWVTRRKEPGA